MPVAKPRDAAGRAHAAWAIPVEAGVPVVPEPHHRRVRVGGVAAEIGEHGLHPLQGRAAVAASGQTVARHRRGRGKEPAKLRRHGPDPGLHHHLGQVPQRLHLDHAAVLDAEELVVAHVRQVAGGRDAQKRRKEGAHELPHAADPVGAFGRGATDHDHVAAFEVRHGGQKIAQRRLQVARSGALAPRMPQPHLRPGRDHRKGGVEPLGRGRRQRLPIGRERRLESAGLGHSAASRGSAAAP